MSYEPSEFGLEVLEDIRTFCQRDLKDLLIEAEKQGEWPEAAYAAAAEMGIGTLPSGSRPGSACLLRCRHRRLLYGEPADRLSARETRNDRAEEEML